MAGRPRKHSRTETLERALEVFWARGYDATSVAHLTEACGVGPSSLYRTFGSKEGLYRQALEHYQRRDSGFARDALAQAALWDGIDQLLHGAADVFTRPGCPPGCAVLSAAATGCDDDVAVELRRRTLTAITARVQAAEGAGELGPDTSAEGLARAIAAAMTGLSALARDGADRAGLHDAATEAVAALRSRLRRPEG